MKLQLLIPALASLASAIPATATESGPASITITGYANNPTCGGAGSFTAVASQYFCLDLPTPAAALKNTVKNKNCSLSSFQDTQCNIESPAYWTQFGPNNGCADFSKEKPNKAKSFMYIC